MNLVLKGIITESVKYRLKGPQRRVKASPTIQPEMVRNFPTFMYELVEVKLRTAIA